MRRVKRTMTELLVVAVTAIAAASISVAVAAPSAKCPLIWAPVICDGGKVYPNQCVANQHHARNCVPYTDGI